MPSRIVGLIGIGLVGSALAERLDTAGWQVVGYDIDDVKRQALASLRGSPVASPQAVMAAADLIILSLPTSTISASLLASLEEYLRGKIIVDTTTGEPDEMAAIGARVELLGGRYLDATIAGSSQQVRSGEVTAIVGGPPDTVAACERLFQSFAARTFHVGPLGSGARMKLVVNLVLGLHRAVLAEGLSFAERSGIDPRMALEVLRGSPAYSRVMDTKGEKMLQGNFTPEARLAQHLKDVRLILAASEQQGAILPLSTLHAELLGQLDRAGLGELDNSAIIQAFTRNRPNP